ncbi:hypothetical protein V1477_016318 [Vespula maculifrons]|uniref:Uncharacterized protein n=2 Tax=Vespula TaxID=7451 RepID=A0A834K3V4_VESVU|nr:hypothetical protein HZH66_006804 [Vespula vulgaris]
MKIAFEVNFSIFEQQGNPSQKGLSSSLIVLCPRFETFDLIGGIKLGFNANRKSLLRLTSSVLGIWRKRYEIKKWLVTSRLFRSAVVV